MMRIIDDAKRQKVDLVAFPEMCVGGYFLADKWQEESFCQGLMEYNESLREASSEGIAIAYGNICADLSISSRVRDDKPHPNKDGRTRKYNSVYVFQDGKPAPRLKKTNILPEGVVPKTLLPNYRIFDDERYFFSTQDIAKDFGVSLESLLQPLVIQVEGEDGGRQGRRKKVPVGFELCEDLWCEDYRRKRQALNTSKILVENGAKLILNLSASPWTFGKNAARDRRIRFLKKESGDRFVPFLYVNCVGAQNNGKDIVLFDGGSTVYNSDGLPVVLGDCEYQEQLIVIRDSDIPAMVPLKRVEAGEIERKFKGIIRGIRHMNDVLGREPRYVIGISGGIDSAVVASLLTIAVGKDKVTGVSMPTKYNSLQTRESAKHVARSLGIEYLVMPIDNLVQSNRQILQDSAGQNHAMSKTREGTGRRTVLGSVLEQNIQAKVRMQILSNLAQQRNGLYICNSNKWEIATGYCTLDGDARGAFAPIGDLTKSEVIRLAQYLNQNIFGRKVIPTRLISLKIPSGPELEENQVSPLKVHYHCALLKAFTDFRARSAEDIMKWYVNGTLEENLGITHETIRDYRLDIPSEFMGDLEWFSSQIQKSVFKRIQGPPIILLSKTAYGYDRRESILPVNENSRMYNRLKAEVLSMREYKQA
jgi:NAD+ synthase (glutamine-hydrolysing)